MTMREYTDLAIYNEATGFSIHPRGMGGLDREQLDANLRENVERGLVIPVELVQDDPLIVRVVLGDLTPEEESEWVGRIVHTLRVPCGSLAVEGGLDPSTDDESEYVLFVDVPPGDYRVEVLTYLHGINSDYCVSELSKEKLGTWFRRTRPNAEMPLWLKLYLVDEPDADPGHEKEWEAYADEIDSLSESEYDALMGSQGFLDFVIHLTPLAEAADDAAPESEPTEEGWFDIDTGARRPELCPLGIEVDEARLVHSLES
jgi:hypothetical protein